MCILYNCLFIYIYIIDSLIPLNSSNMLDIYIYIWPSRLSAFASLTQEILCHTDIIRSQNLGWNFVLLGISHRTKINGFQGVRFHPTHVISGIKLRS